MNNNFFCYIITEHPTSNKNINAIKEVIRLFNELRSNLSSNETKIIRRKLYKKNKKKTPSMFFKEKEHNAFQDATDLLNEHRSNLSLKERNKIRKKLFKKEVVYNFLKDEE